jgi:class 3 adenylate cyclase
VKLGPIGRIIVAHGLANLLAVVHGLGYAVLVADQDTEGVLRGIVQWALITTSVVYATVTLPLQAISRPVKQVLDGDRLKPGVSPGALEAARLRALAMPLGFSSTSMAVWIVSALTYPLYQHLAGIGSFNVALRVITETLVVGAIGSTLVHYAVEQRVRSQLVPILFPQGVGLAKAQWHLNVGGKLMLLMISAAAVPIAALTALRLDPWQTTQVFIYFGVTFVLLGYAQTRMIRRSVFGPVREVLEGMKRLRSGDLDFRVDVRSADEVGRLGAGFNQMVEGLKQAERIKNTFGVYVHPRFVEELAAGKLELGGELRTATVLFADIRGFTPMSERLPPTEVVAFLNRYLDLMVEAITEHGGTVDKFIGDGIMAGFGAPLSLGDDARHAVKASLAMLARLDQWNAERKARGEAPVEIGIGLHTGEVVAGSIGSARKMQYTLIGDAVNTAARLEQLTKELGARLVVSQQTLDRLNGKATVKPHGAREVKGKREPIQVYEVTGLESA